MHFQTYQTCSPENGMNLYRGCTHGCIYCDSRSDCYHMDHAFEDVEVKRDAPAMLRRELSRKRRPCMIGTGSMCDPYLHCEEALCYTRQCLEEIERQGFGVAILTKSDRILRDLDVLKRINEKTRCVVQMTLTCADDDMSHKIEPQVCTTTERIAVLKTLHAHGIQTVVWLGPILPFLTDTRENLSRILTGCVEAGVWGIVNFGMGLTLRAGNREYFYEKLDELFPGLRAQYERRYGDSYGCESPNRTALLQFLHETCRREGIVCDARAVFAELQRFEDKRAGTQLSLF